MQVLKLNFKHILLCLTTILFILTIAPTTGYAGATPVQKEISVTPAAKKTKKKRAKKSKKRKKIKTQAGIQHRNKQAFFDAGTLWIFLGILLTLGAGFMWLFGAFKGFKALMWIGLSILFVMSALPVIISPFLAIITYLVVALVIALFLWGYFSGINWLMISMMILFILLIIASIILAILTYF